MRLGYFLLMIYIVIMTSAQIFFKFAAIHLNHHESLVDRWINNPSLVLAYILSAAGFLIWIKTLKYIQLSIAYPTTAAIYLLTPLAGWFLFNEVISTLNFVGLIIIFLGIILVNSSEFQSKNDN